MEEHVEGEWNGFFFRKATEADETDITQLLHLNYFPGDAVTVTAGLPDFEEYENDYKKMWTSFLKENLSFVAIDIASKKLAAVRINYEHRKDMVFSKFNLKSRQMTLIAAAKKINESTALLFERYAHVDKHAVFFVACVAHEFRRRGLATEMYRRSINLLRAKGYFLVKSSFNSPYTRKAAQNLGFVEFADTRYMDLKDQDGSRLLPLATPEHGATLSVYFL